MHRLSRYKKMNKKIQIKVYIYKLWPTHETSEDGFVKINRAKI